MKLNNGEESEYSLKRIQACLLDIFQAYAIFCEENGLQYYITGGTLLGAVRHRGFIPWDDDLDVCMPRPDYERFLEMADQKISSRYCIQHFGNTSCHPRLYARFADTETLIEEKYLSSGEESHLGIDVFPIDGVPECEREQRAYFYKLKFLRRLFICCNCRPFRGESLVMIIAKTLLYIPCRAIGASRIYTRIQRELSRYKYEVETNAAIAIGCYNKKELVKKEVLEPAYAEFEGIKVPVFNNYGSYLIQLYGEDYMEMPPECKRQRHHGFKVLKL